MLHVLEPKQPVLVLIEPKVRQKHRDKKQHSRRARTAQIRAKTDQLGLDNQYKLEQVEAKRQAAEQGEANRLNRLLQSNESRAGSAIDINNAQTQNRLLITNASGQVQSGLVAERHQNAMEISGQRRDDQIAVIQARQAARTEVGGNRGGGGIGGGGAQRFMGGRMGNIGGSLLYAQGAMANELGTGGGKTAANMASVSRGLGSVATGVELLGLASGGARACQ